MTNIPEISHNKNNLYIIPSCYCSCQYAKNLKFELRYSSAVPNCNASSHAEPLRDVKAMYHGLMHLNHHVFLRTLQHSAKSRLNCNWATQRIWASPWYSVSYDIPNKMQSLLLFAYCIFSYLLIFPELIDWLNSLINAAQSDATLATSAFRKFITHSSYIHCFLHPCLANSTFFSFNDPVNCHLFFSEVF